MRRLSQSIAVVVLAAIVFGIPGEAWAEVSSRRERDRARTLTVSDSLQSIADDPDPIPSIQWEPLHPPTIRRLINPSGDTRPDGSPHVAYHPVSGWPVVVWAYNNGIDHDIAFSKWTGAAWSDVLFITSSTDDERDPEAVVAPDGTVHVVWWVDSAEPKVMTATLGPVDTNFAVTSQVSPVGEHVARPSVALAGGIVWIAYEKSVEDGTPVGGVNSGEMTSSRTDSGAAVAFGRNGDASNESGTDTGGVGTPLPVATQITVNRTLTDGGYQRALTINSSRSGAHDIEIHAHNGQLWIEWKKNGTQFSFTDTDAATGGTGWAGVRSLPWPDPSWIGQEDVRQSVRQTVLQGDAVAIDPTE